MRKEMFAKYGDVAKYGLAMGPAYECADVPDETYEDGRVITSYSIHYTKLYDSML